MARRHRPRHPLQNERINRELNSPVPQARLPAAADQKAATLKLHKGETRRFREDARARRRSGEAQAIKIFPSCPARACSAWLGWRRGEAIVGAMRDGGSLG